MHISSSASSLVCMASPLSPFSVSMAFLAPPICVTASSPGPSSVHMSSALGPSSPLSVSIALPGPSSLVSSETPSPPSPFMLPLYPAYPTQLLVPAFDDSFSDDSEPAPTAPAVRLRLAPNSNGLLTKTYCIIQQYKVLLNLWV